MSLRDAGTAIILGFGLPLVWISVVLHLLTPWRRTEMGRHLVVHSTAIALVLTFALAHRMLGDSLLLEVIRFFAYSILVFAFGWRVCLQFRAYRDGEGSFRKYRVPKHYI